MVFAFLAVNYYPVDESKTKDPSANFLLSSFIADGDLVTDWMYFVDIWTNASKDMIPQWLLNLQMISCIFGTIAWFTISTDGRVIQW
eukprot:CAMPEP_0184871734 /NCGR_PEP_ID=MMETSP0580-20130426/40891_1 /TAXON_ID=1118495 /ORGANISM="Dactyliosolen fragilissimus" /LENGTH=86 /DNA_ID=CAMNT_0027374437 /DNA_START=490 /DNA_END=747 /DNA_ORIENTATION=-